MGQLERLGAESWAQGLDAVVVQMVLEQVREVRRAPVVAQSQESAVRVAQRATPSLDFVGGSRLEARFVRGQQLGEQCGDNGLGSTVGRGAAFF